MERVDRTTALKLFSGAKARQYPSREDLLRFGKSICLVDRPGDAIDRIATAMTETLEAHRPRLAGEYGELLVTEWEGGRLAMVSSRLFPAHPDRKVPPQATGEGS